MARRALGPATLSLVQAVHVALTPQDDSLLVACSGGPDSLALAAATLVVATRAERAHAVVVVDHGLQAGSVDAAANAAAAVRRMGYDDVRVIQVTVDLTSGSGPEAAARTARYAALRAEAADNGSTVLLGHTRDDQAETVLLGLARGSGPRSLAGMAPRTPPFVRPLLQVARTVTEQACRELGLQPWRDPHNDDPAYARVRVRHRVLPLLEAELGPGVAAALARTANLLRTDTDLLDRLAAEADPATDELGCALLVELPHALRGRVIRRWLARHGVTDAALAHVAMVEDLAVDSRGGRRVDLPGLTVARVGPRLRVRRPPEGETGV